MNTLPLALECASRFGGAVVYDSHEMFTEAGSTSQLPAPVRAFLRHLERGWAKRAAAIVTVNDSIAEVLGSSLGRDDVRVLRNCASPPEPGMSPLRARIGVGPNERVILYHGSITVGRGLERLIAAFDDPRLAGAHLVIMGFGPLRPTLQDLAAASFATARIHILPPVPPAELTAWVAGADIAAMPIEPTTLNHRLSSPNKLFEAIAAGVPVVGPDFVEFRRIVTEGPIGPLGVLHDDHRPTTIASAIHALAALPDERLEAYRDRCRQASAARWNWTRETDTLVSLYAWMSAARLNDTSLSRQVAPLAGEAE
jgi:glycosyltransferase involved in cell wall biosynthesis